MKISPRLALVTLVTVAAFAWAPPLVPAKGKGQIKQAQKLLEKLKLVDGAGSGLDADSVQGMTPADVAASVPPPTPVETLQALRQVDGPGSGLDADTLRGLTPQQLAASGGSGQGGLNAVDSTGVPVGTGIQFDVDEFRIGRGYAVRRIDGLPIMLPFTANGFGYWDWESGAPSDGDLFTAHESTDCSGPLLMERFGGVVDLVKKATVVGGRAYYGNGVVADKMVSSVRSNGSDAARCTSFACGRFEGAVGVFTAPDICCCSGGSRLPYLASVEEIVSVDLASLGTPPFRIDVP